MAVVGVNHSSVISPRRISLLKPYTLNFEYNESLGTSQFISLRKIRYIRYYFNDFGLSHRQISSVFENWILYIRSKLYSSIWKRIFKIPVRTRSSSHRLISKTAALTFLTTIALFRHSKCCAETGFFSLNRSEDVRCCSASVYKYSFIPKCNRRSPDVFLRFCSHIEAVLNCGLFQIYGMKVYGMIPMQNMARAVGWKAKQSMCNALKNNKDFPRMVRDFHGIPLPMTTSPSLKDVNTSYRSPKIFVWLSQFCILDTWGIVRVET